MRGIIFRERFGLQYMLSFKTSDRQDFYFSFISFLTGMSGDVSNAQNLEKQAVIGCSDNRDTALVIQRDWVKKQKLARPVEADQQRMASCLLAALGFSSLSHNLSLSLKHFNFGSKMFPLLCEYEVLEIWLCARKAEKLTCPLWELISLCSSKRAWGVPTIFRKTKIAIKTCSELILDVL